jgi:hypothetical protein
MHRSYAAMRAVVKRRGGGPLPMWRSLPGRGLQYPGLIADLNAQGCLIETKCKLEAGTAVEVWMRTEGMPLRLAARLVERQARGVQFEFQAMPMRKQEQLEILRLELEQGRQ